MKRGEVWWADLGPYRSLEQTGHRPVVVWQSDLLNRFLSSVLVVPLTTNLDRANLPGTVVLTASPSGLREDSVALAFQLRAIPKSALESKIRVLTAFESAEQEAATDEALGRVDIAIKTQEALEGPPEPRGLWERLLLWTGIAVILSIVAYGPALYHLLSMERFGSLPFSPF